MDQELANAAPAPIAAPSPPGRRPVSKLRRRLLVGAVVVLNLTFVLVLCSPLLEYANHSSFRLFGFFGTGIELGFLYSQSALVAFWAAFGGGRTLWRSLAVVLAVIAALWLIGKPGFELNWGILSDLRCYTPIVLLGPVWALLLIARLLGLGLVSTPDAPRTLQPLQFSIADMLLWTTVVAVVSGLLRWLALDWSVISREMVGWDAWRGFFFWGMVAMAAMFLALGRGHAILRILLLLLSLGAYLGMLEIIYGSGWDWGCFAGLFGEDPIPIGPMAGWLVGSLWLIRLAGYRLAWQWRFGRRTA
ncbi:MAG: hypothetical protein ACLQLG_14685 [Thermoguttaceae bacterium]